MTIRTLLANVIKSFFIFKFIPCCTKLEIPTHQITTKHQPISPSSSMNGLNYPSNQPPPQLYSIQSILNNFPHLQSLHLQKRKKSTINNLWTRETTHIALIWSNFFMEDQPLSSKSKTAALDQTLHSIGFEIEDLSPQKISGRLPVTQKCCQVNPISFFFLSIKSILSLVVHVCQSLWWSTNGL